MPSSGIMNASSAMPGMVCSRPTARTVASAPREKRSRPTPSGTATATAAASESATSSRCRAVMRSRSRRRSTEIAREALPVALDRGGRLTDLRGESQVGQRIGRHALHRLALDLEPLVETAHGRHVQPSAQLRQRRNRRRARSARRAAHQGRRLVRREEPPVVLQHHEIVARDQPVGRVPVDHVHLAGGERLVLHRGEQCAHFGEAEAVRAREARQPVGAADEVRREAGAELRTHAGQVAQGLEPVSLRGLAPHRDGVGVLEAERRQPADAPSRGGTRG